MKNTLYKGFWNIFVIFGFLIFNTLSPNCEKCNGFVPEDLQAPWVYNPAAGNPHELCQTCFCAAVFENKDSLESACPLCPPELECSQRINSKLALSGSLISNPNEQADAFNSILKIRHRQRRYTQSPWFMLEFKNLELLSSVPNQTFPELKAIRLLEPIFKSQLPALLNPFKAFPAAVFIIEIDGQQLVLSTSDQFFGTIEVGNFFLMATPLHTRPASPEPRYDFEASPRIGLPRMAEDSSSSQFSELENYESPGPQDSPVLRSTS